ncbi:hypothetical protein L9F63_019070, partial [Diploptera punctata]
FCSEFKNNTCSTCRRLEVSGHKHSPSNNPTTNSHMLVVFIKFVDTNRFEGVQSFSPLPHSRRLQFYVKLTNYNILLHIQRHFVQRLIAFPTHYGFKVELTELSTYFQGVKAPITHDSRIGRLSKKMAGLNSYHSDISKIYENRILTELITFIWSTHNFTSPRYV